MDFKIPPVLNADRLMDKAYRRAGKIQKRGKDREDGYRKTVAAKLKLVSKILEKTLKRYEESFPSFDRLPPFYRDTIHIQQDLDRVKKSIGATNWARRRIKRAIIEDLRKLRNCESVDEMEKVRKSAYGRTSSFLRQVSEDLEFLEEVRKKLNTLPDIRMDRPTLVVAGSPNVGKSHLVSRISTGKPKIAVYPFTTKEVGVGHFYADGLLCQMVDTPGLLDRPLEERNEIEMQAVKAIDELADLVIFVYDPSGSCGYPIAHQNSLYQEISRSFEKTEIIEVYNKSDIMECDTGLSVSALTGENLDKLKELMSEKIKRAYKERWDIEVLETGAEPDVIK
ncbi:MAG: GTPase [Thermoplasmata archaeon]